MAENLANDIATALGASIADGVTTSITTTGATGMPAANFRVRIDNEILLVTSIGGGTNWTVQRGVEGSTAAAHSNGATVVHILTAAGLEQFAQDRGGYSVGAQAAIRLNAQTISENLTTPDNTNGSTVGPITIASGFTVTIGASSYWVILGA